MASLAFRCASGTLSWWWASSAQADVNCSSSTSVAASSATPDVNSSSSMSAVASSATSEDFLTSISILVMSALLPSDGFPEFIDVSSSASRCVKPFADVNSLLRCLLGNRQCWDASHCDALYS